MTTGVGGVRYNPAVRGLEPGDEVGGWVVRGLLGRGGLAEVYDVEHADGRRGALKRLHHTRVDAVARLRREAEALRSLVHPNVVQLVAWIEPTPEETASGTSSLVMERVEGPTLLEHAATLDLAGVEALFVQILAGVQAAHAAGWVHRDLKPSNVLVHVEEGQATAKVADFGLASLPARDTRLTASGVFMGTPAYMAPEQVMRPSEADVRADVFSLGAVLYELVCRRPPFVSDDVFVVLDKARRGAYPDPATLRPDLPERMRQAIRGALWPDPDQRIGDCAGLAEVLRGERSWTVPEGPRDVSTEVAPRRRRWTARAVAGLVGLVVIGLSLGAYLMPASTVALPPVVSAEAAVQARFEQAWHAWAEARLEEAEDLLPELLEELPEEPWVHTVQAFVLSAERSELAVDAFARAEARATLEQPVLSELLEALTLDYEGENDRLWTRLARAHRGHGLVQAVACAQLGWGSAAERACARADQLGPMPVIWWRLGQDALERWEFEDAEAYAELLLARDPEHARALTLVGQVRSAEGAWGEAHELAQRALATSPDLPEAHRLVARSLAHRGDLDGARALYAGQLDPARPLDVRAAAAHSLAMTELGLGVVEDGQRVLADVAAAAQAAERFDLVGELWVRDALLAWYLRDVPRLRAARRALREVLLAPELSPTVAQPMRASVVYMEGIEGILVRDPDRVARARERLARTDVDSVAWRDRWSAMAILEAQEQDLRGDPSALLAIVRGDDSCEIVALGGQLLVDRGYVDEGFDKLGEAAGVCPRSGVGLFHTRRSAAVRAQIGALYGR